MKKESLKFSDKATIVTVIISLLSVIVNIVQFYDNKAAKQRINELEYKSKKIQTQILMQEIIPEITSNIRKISGARPGQINRYFSTDMNMFGIFKDDLEKYIGSITNLVLFNNSQSERMKTEISRIRNGRFDENNIRDWEFLIIKNDNKFDLIINSIEYINGSIDTNLDIDLKKSSALVIPVGFVQLPNDSIHKKIKRIGYGWTVGNTGYRSFYTLPNTKVINGMIISDKENDLDGVFLSPPD